MYKLSIDEYTTLQDILKVSSIICTSLGSVTLLFAYLQGYFAKDRIAASKYDDFLYRNSYKYPEENTENYYSNLIEHIENRLNILEIKTSELSMNTDSNENFDRNIEKLKTDLMDNASEELIKNIKESFSKELTEDAKHKKATAPFVSARNRFRTEINDLTRRATINLICGLTITGFGVGVLGYFVSTYPSEFKDTQSVFAYNFPRLSLVALIEIFSYFFLKLYKSSLDEIKFYHNEITKIEMGVLGLRTALFFGTNDLVKPIADNLYHTEKLTKPENNFRSRKSDSALISRLIDIFEKQLEKVGKA